MSNRAGTWMIAAALAGSLSGCSDFSRHTFGGIRRSADSEEGTPRPGPALAIRNPPASDPPKRDELVKPATLVVAPPTPTDPATKEALRGLYLRAAKKHTEMQAYTYRLKRREVVAGRKLPEELSQVRLRYQPFSVHIKGLAGPGKEQEVLYVQNKYDNKIQVMLAADDLRAVFGRRKSAALDDALVKASSRYPITETGLGSMIDHFGRNVAGIDKGDPWAGSAKYLGRLKRPEFTGEVEAVYQVVPAGDPALPKGGQRWWFFDAASGLPVLRIAHDASGEVEYYCHDHIQWPVRMTDDDFNPEQLWRK